MRDKEGKKKINTFFLIQYKIKDNETLTDIEQKYKIKHSSNIIVVTGACIVLCKQTLAFLHS